MTREHLPLLTQTKWYTQVKRLRAWLGAGVLLSRNIRSYMDIRLGRGRRWSPAQRRSGGGEGLATFLRRLAYVRAFLPR